MTSPVAAIISRRGECSFASSIGTGSLRGEARRDPKREVRTLAGLTAARFRPPSSIPRKIRPASPPPVASSPDPAGAVPDPGSGHPHRMDKGGHNVFAWHPDIPNAVPAPVTRLPDITGSRWRGSHLDHGRGRSKAHHDPDAGNAGTGDKRQGRGAENGKNRSSAHLQVPRNLASPKPPIGRGMDRSLTAVNTFRFCAPRRPPTDGLWAQD
jgi:hypothetical protein